MDVTPGIVCQDLTPNGQITMVSNSNNNNLFGYDDGKLILSAIVLNFRTGQFTLQLTEKSLKISDHKFTHREIKHDQVP